LLSFRQAESHLQALKALKTLGELKPYRGRMGLLETEIERRLQEFKGALNLNTLPLHAFTLNFDAPREPRAQLAAFMWNLELEGRGSTYFASRIYRYAPDTDPPFERTTVNKIEVGDYVFDLTEQLRAQMEAALTASGNQNLIPESASALILKTYHKEVLDRCERLYPARNQARRVRDLHAKMVQYDGKVANCTHNRIRYWLSLTPTADADAAPQASRDERPFLAFCKALEIPEVVAKNYWDCVRAARWEHQFAGRRVAELYFDILFRPEDSEVHHKIPRKVIARLCLEATNCVFRVKKIRPPAETSGKDSE
jgi:hypothetical protein